MSLGRIKGGKYTFVGLRNYARILQNSDFYQSLSKTAVYTLFFLIICIGFGLILALLFNRRNRLTPLYMACIFIPSILSEVVSGTMWSWMFQQTYGIIQVALNPFINNFSLLSRPAGAMAIVIAASIWKHLSFTSLLFLGALQTVPREVYESAALDGATSWKSFWKITMPIIRPTMLVAILLTSIRGINALGLILATTKGGPGAATMTTAVYLYRTAWQFGDFGMAAALSVVMFVINVILAVVYIRLLRK
ncbi:MAG: sugar ABC transporter permease [Anaerolineaceae bacterium]|nr:sugar ABC transporter permease [Anaerolineaceae bacterium]